MAKEARKPTALERRIYDVVRKIPKGRVVTYGQVATLAGAPGRSRAVGAAMRRSGDQGLPWQRVVGKASSRRGVLRISDGDGRDCQRELLGAEGISFLSENSLCLERYGWLPTDL